MSETKSQVVIHLDGVPKNVGYEEELIIRYDTGSAIISTDSEGSLRIFGSSQSADDIRLNGRDLPRWIGKVALYPGDELILGERNPVRVNIPGKVEQSEEPYRPGMTIKLARNRASVKLSRLIFLGVDDNDTKAMLKWDGTRLHLASALPKEIAFIWQGKANYFFPYQWYGVTTADEVRAGGLGGPRIDFPQCASENSSAAPLLNEGTTDPPILYIDSERIRSLVAGEMEIDVQESERLPRSPFIENLLCLSSDQSLDSGWRIRGEAVMNRRKFFFGKRLADDSTSLIEIDIPNHRLNPREFYERADFALSSVRHPHIVQVMEYGTIPHPGDKHGDYHVRVQERFAAVGLSQVLNQCGKFDTKTVLSIMIPVLDALLKASGITTEFAPSKALVKTRQMYGAVISDKNPRVCGEMLSNLVTINQLWLCSLADGRLIAKVDCHIPANFIEIMSALKAEDNELELGSDPKVAQVACVGRVLHKLITGRTYRAVSGKVQLSEDLTGFESRIEELAISCIRGVPFERPKSVSAVKNMLEEVWRHLHF